MSKLQEQKQKDYARRQIVSRFGLIGTYQQGLRRYPIWRYLTFYTGPNTPPIAAKFVREADRDKQGIVHIDHLPEGTLVVDPCFIYEKIPMSGFIMAAHLRKMRLFRPRDEVVYEKSKDGPIDVGEIDLTGVTKQ